MYLGHWLINSQFKFCLLLGVFILKLCYYNPLIYFFRWHIKNETKHILSFLKIRFQFSSTVSCLRFVSQILHSKFWLKSSLVLEFLLSSQILLLQLCYLVNYINVSLIIYFPFLLISTGYSVIFLYFQYLSVYIYLVLSILYHHSESVSI